MRLIYAIILIAFTALFSSAMGQENAANYWMERAVSTPG
jgi:hypothetical protein